MVRHKGKPISRSDRGWGFAINAFLLLTALLALYPMYFILIGSFSNPDLVNSGKVWMFPQGVTLDGYKRIFRYSAIWQGYGNSIVYMGLGTAINLLLTIPAGYALSRKDLVGGKSFTLFIMITMFVQGGTIPRYLLVRNLQMLDSIWAMVLPKAVVVWNLIVTTSFFRSTIPEELRESAQIDGAGNGQFFFKIVLPLSSSIVAVMALFYGVGHWNAYFDAMIFLNDNAKYPLQIVLRNVLLQSQMDMNTMDADSVAQMQHIAELVKYGIIIVSIAPMMVLYPFLQRYFVTGVMIGALKG